MARNRTHVSAQNHSSARWHQWKKVNHINHAITKPNNNKTSQTNEMDYEQATYELPKLKVMLRHLTEALKLSEELPSYDIYYENLTSLVKATTTYVKRAEESTQNYNEYAFEDSRRGWDPGEDDLRDLSDFEAWEDSREDY